jgi:hypothetical protein
MEKPRCFPRGGFLFGETGMDAGRIGMDREEGFPPHVIGFMRRKREKERLETEKGVRLAISGDEQGRAGGSA